MKKKKSLINDVLDVLIKKIYSIKSINTQESNSLYFADLNSRLHHVRAISLALIQDVVLELLMLLALCIGLALVVLLALVDIILFQLGALSWIINHIVTSILIDLEQPVIEHQLHVLVHHFCLADLLLRFCQSRLHLLPLLQFHLDFLSFVLIPQLILDDLGLASPPDG